MNNFYLLLYALIFASILIASNTTEPTPHYAQEITTTATATLET